MCAAHNLLISSIALNPIAAHCLSVRKSHRPHPQKDQDTAQARMAMPNPIHYKGYRKALFLLAIRWLTKSPAGGARDSLKKVRPDPVVYGEAALLLHRANLHGAEPTP